MPEENEGQRPDEESLEPEQEVPEQDKGDEDDEDEFDAERALSTIRHQREVEIELKKQLTAVKKQLTQFEAAEKKRVQAEMTELEKAQEELATLQAQNAEAIAALNELRLVQAFNRTAEGMEGVAFANPQAREDAFQLLDLGDITIDDEGQVDGKALEKAIKALQKSRPHLFSEEKKDAGPGTPRGRTRLPAPERKGEEPQARPLVQF